jgi:SHS2 domain-containing protein
MPYDYVDDVAISDVAFRAWGATLEEVFTAAADATMQAMVDDLDTLQPQEQQSFKVRDAALDLLLLNFLQEIIYYKDAQRLLLRITDVTITPDEQSGYIVRAQAAGEVLNADRHELAADVKGITLHRLQVVETAAGWEATVVLDV